MYDTLKRDLVATAIIQGSHAIAGSASKGVDRRISRSRKAMRRAYIDLAREKGIDGFTVNDLCERADVNRGTFYNHFKDKEDIAEAMQSEFMAGLEDFRTQMQKMTVADIARAKLSKKPIKQLVELFDYLREQSDFLCVMLGVRGDAKFGHLFRDTLCRDLILSLLHDKYRKDPTPFVNYYVTFYSAAYLSVITEWLSGGMKETSEEMARIAARLFFIRPGESIVL